MSKWEVRVGDPDGSYAETIEADYVSWDETSLQLNNYKTTASPGSLVKFVCPMSRFIALKQL